MTTEEEARLLAIVDRQEALLQNARRRAGEIGWVNAPLLREMAQVVVDLRDEIAATPVSA